MAKRKTKSKSEGYIEKRPGVRGVAPVIAGTGIKVLDVAVRYELTYDPGGDYARASSSYIAANSRCSLLLFAHKAELDKQGKASVKRVARLRARTASILEEKLGPVKNLHG
jgi:hypothetical protein